jgi:hypothetical protein
MQWVLYGELTPAVTEALRRHEQTVHDVAELGLEEGATLIDLLRMAEQKQWEVLTNDSDLANAPFEQHFPFNRVMVFLQLPGGDVEQDDAIDRLFARYKAPKPGMLYTVTESRVKVRQLPGA